MSTMQCPRCWVPSSICPALPSVLPPAPPPPLPPPPRNTTVQSSSPAHTQPAKQKSCHKDSNPLSLAFLLPHSALSGSIKDAFWKLIRKRGTGEGPGAAAGREGGERDREREQEQERERERERAQERGRREGVSDEGLRFRMKEKAGQNLCYVRYTALSINLWLSVGHLDQTAQYNTARKTQLCPLSVSFSLLTA